MSDLIEKQAVLDAMCDASIPIVYKGKPSFVVDYVGVIADIPSASTEKTGHWIHRKMDNECWEECSECHVERAYPTLYCPDCGAKMEEDK